MENATSSQFAFYILQELQKHGSPDMIMALVGNKADLHYNRSVSSQVCIYIFLKVYVALLIEDIRC